MSRPTGLILDFGGVLTTSVRECALAFDRREGLPAGTFLSVTTEDPVGSALWAAVERGAISQEQWNEGTAALLGVDGTDLVARFLADLRPEPSVIAAARAARAAGIRVGILSNSLGTEPYDIYTGYDLTADYDVVLISQDHKLRKPEPEIYTAMLRRMELPGDACVFVDDTERNLPPAEHLGMATVLAVRPADTIARMEAALGTRLA